MILLERQSLTICRHAFRKTTKLVKARLADFGKPLESELQPILVRNAPKHPIHRAALLRQSKGRWYTTHSTINASVRRFMSSIGQNASRYDRASLPKSVTATAVSRLTTRAPFASILRPNLTGGALPRTAGGYSIGGGGAGGARYFSHTPAAPAQVVNNVSAACRAFWLSGQKAQFTGMNAAGEKRFRSVSTLQDEVLQKVRKAAPGSFIDFSLKPTITALSPLSGAFAFDAAEEQSAPSLNTEGLLDVLSVDFSRALKDFAAVMNDLKRLKSLGDLPITLEEGSKIRVKFPGCDADTVERLCDEMGVQRGVIHQDPRFMQSVGGEVALRFPFASTSEHTLSSPGGSRRSQTGLDMDEMDEFEENPWLEGYESMDESDVTSFPRPSQLHSSSSFEGVEGIHKFLEQCDRARRI